MFDKLTLGPVIVRIFFSLFRDIVHWEKFREPLVLDYTNLLGIGKWSEMNI